MLVVVVVVRERHSASGGVVHEAKGTVGNVGKCLVSTVAKHVANDSFKLSVQRGNLRFRGADTRCSDTRNDVSQHKTRIVVVRMRHHHVDNLQTKESITKLGKSNVVGFDNGALHKLDGIDRGLRGQTPQGHFHSRRQTVTGLVPVVECIILRKTSGSRSWVFHNRKRTIVGLGKRVHARGTQLLAQARFKVFVGFGLDGHQTFATDRVDGVTRKIIVVISACKERQGKSV